MESIKMKGFDFIKNNHQDNLVISKEGRNILSKRQGSKDEISINKIAYS